MWNATRLVWFNLFAIINVADLSPNYMEPLHVTYSNCLRPSGMRTMTLSQSTGNMHGWEVADQARRRAEMARYMYKCIYMCVPSSLTFMLLAWETKHSKERGC